MSETFATRYRVSRDSFDSRYWMVEKRVWFWPFWTEVGNGLLNSKQDAIDLIETLRREYRP